VAEARVLTHSRTRRVFAYSMPCDMRKQYDSLAVLVTRDMGKDLLHGDLFLFVGRTRKRAKVLYFDGTGLCLFAKRLERGHFAAPWQGRSELTETELSLLLEGAEMVGRIVLSPPVVSPSDRQVVFR
jgi:transposase